MYKYFHLLFSLALVLFYSLCQPIWCWDKVYLLDAIFVQERLKFSTNKARTIIRHNGPNWEKGMCNSVTAADVAEGVLMASIHLKWASTMIRYILPFSGPAKSSPWSGWPLSRMHRDNWRYWFVELAFSHCLTVFSISVVIPSHHTYILATQLLHFHHAGCPSWISIRMALRWAIDTSYNSHTPQ